MVYCHLFATCRLCVPRCKWATLFNSTDVCVFDLGRMGVKIIKYAENRDECPREPGPVAFSATLVGIIVASVVVLMILGAILLGCVWRRCGRRRMGQLAVQQNSGGSGRCRPNREKYEELKGDMEMTDLNAGRGNQPNERVAAETDVDANGSDVSGVTRFGSGRTTVLSAPRSPHYDVPPPIVRDQDKGHSNARAIRWHRKGTPAKKGETVQIDI